MTPTGPTAVDDRAPPEQFATLAGRHDALSLGFWAFLASETLLFAGLFALYAAYRTMYGAEFVAASRHNDVVLGTVNTLVLITSSLSVALAVHEARVGR